MPLFFQRDIDAATKLAVWHITEPETFFLQQVPLQRSITHPHKRLQHLAGRYLLRWLYPDFPIKLIRIADTKKPYLEDEAYHFSISHCANFAAVIVSTERRVGIDVEAITEKIDRIKNKFLSPLDFEKAGLLILEEVWLKKSSQENESIQPAINYRLLTMLWCCKEAVYKWYGRGEVDFKKHIALQKLSRNDAMDYDVTIKFLKGESKLLDLHVKIFDSLVMSYVVT